MNPTPPQPGDCTAPRPAGSPAPNPRRWLFRAAAVLLIPALALGLIEVSLRMLGRGYPATFFIPDPGSRGDRLVTNDRFGWRFFPRSIARTPSPAFFTRTKPAGTFRIFLFGESAALGDPRPAFGMGRYLEALLTERFPGTRFEVICAAMTAINSHALLPMARECARYDGDLWIVYMGNNEMLGPFGAGTVFGPSIPQLGALRMSLALRSTRTGQWLDEVGSRLRNGTNTAPVWEGMKMFLQQQIGPDDARRAIVHSHFQRNLEDIVRAGVRSGAKVVLSTVAVNLRDCPPFASVHGSGFNDAGRGKWEATTKQGRDHQQAGRMEEAGRAFEEALAIDDRFAEVQFRLAECTLALTNRTAARSHFERARDADALPFRTDTRLNAITRETAARHASRGVLLVDAASELARLDPDGVPGEPFFLDHVHLTFDGNHRLARLFAEEVARQLPPSITRGQKPEWADAGTCERRLGLSDWSRNAAFETMLQRLFEAPFTNQANHLPRAASLVARIKEGRSRMTADTVPATRALLEQAVQARPDDHWLLENLAEFLEATGSTDDAAVQWQRVRDLLPHHHAAWFHLGRLLARQGKSTEATTALRQALAIQPALADAHLELAQIHLKDGARAEAIAALMEARRFRPNDARICLQLANATIAAGQAPEAIGHLREAIRLRPDYWEAQYLLGVQLAAAGRFPEAQTAFEAAIRLRPDNASARFNLGVALAKLMRLPEAADAFRETLRLDPSHQRARQYLESIQNMGGQPP